MATFRPAWHAAIAEFCGRPSARRNAPFAMSNALRITVGRSPGGTLPAGTKSPRSGPRGNPRMHQGIRRRRWKWVNVWRTSPGTVAPVGGNRRIGLGGTPSTQSLPGQPSIPPRSPDAGPAFQQPRPVRRRAIGDAEARGFGASGLAGQVGGDARGPRGAGGDRSGQMPQAGFAACRSSRPDPSPPAHGRPGARIGVSVAARSRNSGLAPGSGVSTAKIAP